MSAYSKCTCEHPCNKEFQEILQGLRSEEVVRYKKEKESELEERYGREDAGYGDEDEDEDADEDNLQKPSDLDIEDFLGMLRSCKCFCYICKICKDILAEREQYHQVVIDLGQDDNNDVCNLVAIPAVLYPFIVVSSSGGDYNYRNPKLDFHLLLQFVLEKLQDAISSGDMQQVKKLSLLLKTVKEASVKIPKSYTDTATLVAELPLIQYPTLFETLLNTLK